MLLKNFFKESGPSEQNTNPTSKPNRWLLKIDGQPVAHYSSPSEAKTVKQKLTLKFGMRFNIEIEEIPGDRYKIAEKTAS